MLRILVIALIFTGAVHSGSVSALGLGQLTLQSLLSQPLNVTIDLLDTQKLKPDQIIPKLGSATDFKRTHIERPAFLEKLIFTTIENHGKLHIKISSSGPVNEPMINFLLEIKWPKGRVLREYTILLDPPAFGTREVVYDEQPITEKNNTKIFASEESKAHQNSLTYTVKPNDNLWEITSQFSDKYNIPAEQMMSTIQKANPHAFMQDNPDKLKKGALLNIPIKTEAVNTEHALELTDKTDELIKVQHQQLEKLSSENITLIQKLEQLETQIDQLDSVISNQTIQQQDKSSAVTNKQRLHQPITQTEINRKLFALTTKDDYNHSLTSKAENRPDFEDKHNLNELKEQKKPNIRQDEKITNPFEIKNKSILNTTTAKIQNENPADKSQSWYTSLFSSFNHFLLLSLGAVLVLFLGWFFEKRRKQRKEEDEMNSTLEAEALEAEQKTKNKSTHNQDVTTNATKFSELVNARKQPEETLVKAEVTTETSDQKNSNSEKNRTQQVNETIENHSDTKAENSDFLLFAENEHLSDEAIQDTDNFEENTVSKLTFDLQEDGELANSPHVEEQSDQSQQISDNITITAENLNITESTSETAPSTQEIPTKNEDLSVQLEQLDEEINALSEELSSAKNIEENGEIPTPIDFAEKDSESENENMLSLLDLARAYLEMDDKDEAAGILKKVMQKGHETEKAEAKALLKRCEL